MAHNKVKPTVLCSEMESSRLSFTDLEENDRSKGQKIAYPRYNHPTLGEGSGLILQGEWMEMTQYGVPSLGEYYQEDKDRSFVKVPLDLSKEEVATMVKPLEQLDAHFGSNDFKKTSFGKYAKKYSYQEIVRHPPVDEDEEQTKLPYMKLKLSTSWPDGAVTTKVFLNEKMDDGTVKRTPVEVETVTDFANHVKYLCRFRPIFTPVKMWAQQHKMSDPKYGIVFKLIAIEVEPTKSASSSYQSYNASDLFLDSNDVATTTIQTAKSVTSKLEEDDVDEEAVEDDDSDSDSDSSSDSDSDSDSDEEPVQKKKASKGKGKKGSSKKSSKGKKASSSA